MRVYLQLHWSHWVRLLPLARLFLLLLLLLLHHYILLVMQHPSLIVHLPPPLPRDRRIHGVSSCASSLLLGASSPSLSAGLVFVQLWILPHLRMCRQFNVCLRFELPPASLLLQSLLLPCLAHSQEGMGVTSSSTSFPGHLSDKYGGGSSTSSSTPGLTPAVSCHI